MRVSWNPNRVAFLSTQNDLEPRLDECGVIRNDGSTELNVVVIIWICVVTKNLLIIAAAQRPFNQPAIPTNLELQWKQEAYHRRGKSLIMKVVGRNKTWDSERRAHPLQHHSGGVEVYKRVGRLQGWDRSYRTRDAEEEEVQDKNRGVKIWHKEIQDE